VKWGTEKEKGKIVRPKGGKWEKGGRNALKIGPRTAQLEYIRTHISAFDRTRARRKWCKRDFAFELTG
jgi:hypothetical protein